MQRKSILCSILAFVLILTVFGAARGYAAGSTTLSIIPPPVPVREGEDFTVYVNIYNVVDMVSYQLTVSWDPIYLDYALYSVTPPWLGSPSIILDPIIDRTNGYITLGAMQIDPNAKFSGSATLATLTFHTLKSGTTMITFAESPQIQPLPPVILTNDATATILPAYVWVSVAGTVTSYGSEPALGWVRMFSVKENSIQNWTEGWSLFVVPPIGARIQIFPPPPVDFTVYHVRIVNASAVKLNYNGADLWISGFFRVANVTNPGTLADIAKLLAGGTTAAGEFIVTGNWASFNLTVQGYESILGDVTSHVVRSVTELPDRLPIGDVNGDGKIDITDLAIIAKGYGSYLGDDRYEFHSDINGDFRGDITDLAQCALYYGRSY